MHIQTSERSEWTAVTTRHMTHLLPKVLASIEKSFHQQKQSVAAFWPEIIGSKLAPMTEVVSVCDGLLVVKVKNSTLLSLLSRHEKGRILRLLQTRCPGAEIKNIHFRIG